MKFTRSYLIVLISTILLETACNTQTTDKSGNYKLKGNDSVHPHTARVNAVNENTDSSKTDSIVYLKIEGLPEVHKLASTNGGDKCTIIIQQRPGFDFKYYWVQAGIMHPERFEAILNFYVIPSGFDILYYDTQTDTTLTLKQWRNRKYIMNH